MRCPTCKRELPPPATVCPHDGAYLLAPLSETLKRGPLPLSEATRITERLCDLLAPIHASGRAHTRLTPDNVFFRHVGSDLTVRITEVDEARPVPAARYATPERARGEREDARADIYALGILMHHMIAGAPPFDLGTEAAILKKHAEAEPGTLTALELQDVPDELDSLIKGMLAKQASDRPQNVAEIRETLENIDTGSTITGAKIAALGVMTAKGGKDVKDTDPERPPLVSAKLSGRVSIKQPAPALPSTPHVLDEPTVETKPVFDIASRDSQNPTLFNVERKAPELPDVGEHPTSLEIDPYGDTVLRARPNLGLDAPTKAEIIPRESRVIVERSDARTLEPRPESDTEPPPGPKAPEAKKTDASPRGPTIRTPAPPPHDQRARMAMLILIAALGLVIIVLALVLMTRS